MKVSLKKKKKTRNKKIKNFRKKDFTKRTKYFRET